jgi:hypothetical protein
MSPYKTHSQLISQLKLRLKLTSFLIFINLFVIIILGIVSVISLNYSPQQLEPMLYYEKKIFRHIDGESKIDNFPGIYLITPDGKFSMELLPQNEKAIDNYSTGYSLISPSPDGSKFVLEYSHNLILFETATLKSIPLTGFDISVNGQQLTVKCLGWSPDGNWIAYQAEIDAGLWIISSDGSSSVQVIPRSEGYITLATWYSNYQLRVQGSREGIYGNYLVDINTGEWAFNSSPKDDHIYWAPDNEHHVTIKRDSERIYLFPNKAETSFIDITPQIKNSLGNYVVKWAPNNQWVALEISDSVPFSLTQTSNIYIISSDGKITIDMIHEMYYSSPEGTTVGFRMIDWSPDSSLLAFNVWKIPRPFEDALFPLVESAVYVYNPTNAEYFATPLTAGMFEIKGWWPMTKNIPPFLSLDALRFAVKNRKVLLISLLFSSFAIICLVLVYQGFRTIYVKHIS